jgi:heme-degrading monooxygenase HmoA
MTVIVRVVCPYDTEQFRAWATSGGEHLAALTEQAKAAGCVSHRFAIGDGEVMAIDEWESADAFQEFFAQPELVAALQASGAAGAPDVAYYEPVQSDYQF